MTTSESLSRIMPLIKEMQGNILDDRDECKERFDCINQMSRCPDGELLSLKYLLQTQGKFLDIINRVMIASVQIPMNIEALETAEIDLMMLINTLEPEQ